MICSCPTHAVSFPATPTRSLRWWICAPTSEASELPVTIPFSTMKPAGLEASVILEKVRATVPLARGFDAETHEYVDMMAAGIIDPTKVERVALQHAASIASLLLTTEAIITDGPDAGKADHSMGHGGEF